MAGDSYMKVITLVLGTMGTNTYLAADENSGSAVLIDPAASPDKIMETVQDSGWRMEKILLTHGHFDHIGAVDVLSEQYGVPVFIPEPDGELLADADKNASNLFCLQPVVCCAPVSYLFHGTRIVVGSLEFEIRLTPGHTRGSACFFVWENGCCNAVFTGDTVFADGCGRTDLYGGDFLTLSRTLGVLLPSLSGKIIYPGHGESKQF